MADPVLNPNHVADGLKRLLTQFQGQPNLQGIVSSYLVQAQELENVFISLMVDRYVDNAVGAQLDGIGRVVGQPRESRTDVDYRAAIKGRITRNGANSRVEDLLALFVLLLPNHTFELTEGPGPAAFRIRIVEALVPVTDPSPEVISDQLRDAKGAGIRATLLWSEDDESDTFTIADGMVLQADDDRGMADDTPSTIGGSLSGALS